MPSDDGWEDVTDPREIQKVQKKVLPKAPPGKKSGAVSPQDAKAMNGYRDLSDQADRLATSGRNFLNRADRFHTGAAKSMVFDAMYPNGDGWTGPIKRAGGALLRGTVGNLYSNRDHEDYQYLTANAQALNNAALRLNKGVQTEGDAVRIAKENIGVDKAPQVNRDIFNGQSKQAVAIAKAQQQAASQWIANYGALSGTKNAQGQTYDDWFNRVVRPRAVAQAKAAPAPAKGGWSIVKE